MNKIHSSFTIAPFGQKVKFYIFNFQDLSNANHNNDNPQAIFHNTLGNSSSIQPQHLARINA
jgi:hypothetical protein